MFDTLNTKTRNNLTIPFMNGNLTFGTWIWYSVEDRLLLSENFCQMAGIAKDSYYDFKTFFDLLHGNDLLPFLSEIENMLKGAEPHWISFRIIRPDYTAQRVNCFIESLATEFGDVFDITGICLVSNEKVGIDAKIV